MQLHKTIRLSELPLSGKIVEQSSNVLVTNEQASPASTEWLQAWKANEYSSRVSKEEN